MLVDLTKNKSGIGYDATQSIFVFTYLLTYLYLFHGAESFLKSQLILQLVKEFPAFSEPEGSLPYPQVPATCPYPESTPSRPHNSHFLKIHLNIILPSMSGSPQWSHSLRFPHQNPVHTSPLPHTHHMPRPSHSSRFYHVPSCYLNKLCFKLVKFLLV